MSLAAIEGAYQELVLASGTTANQFIMPATIVSRSKAFSLQLTGVWSATVQVQVSNDGVNYINQTVMSLNTPTGGASNITSTGLYIGPVSTKWMQIQITAFTSGTVTGVVEFYSHPFGPIAQLIAAGSATIGNVGINAGTNSIGRLNAASTVSVAAGTAANTVVKGSPGILYGVFASTAAAGGGQLFDNASTPTGTPIAFAPSAIGYDTGIPSVGINCVNGIVLQGSATNPALTIMFL